MQNETSATRAEPITPVQVALPQAATSEVARPTSSTSPQRAHETATRLVRARAASSSVLSTPKAAWPQKILQNWEGVVVGVSESAFQAHMRSTLSPSSSVEYVDIDLDNVSHGDIGLVRDGAKFYLTVLSVTPPGEGPQKTTRVVFRRIPRMRAEAIADAEQEAAELWALLRPGYEAQFPPDQARGKG